MSRMKNGAARISALVAELDSAAQTALADFLEGAVNRQNAESLDDLADDVKPRRSRKAKVEKPTRRSRKAADEDDDEDEDDGDEDDLADLDDEDDKPKRRTRKSKATAEKPARRSRKAAEPDDEDDGDDGDDGDDVTLDEATYDAIVTFMSEGSFEPVAGGVRELKPLVESWGGDFAELVSGGADRREKAELAGTFIAANKAALAILKKMDEDDINALAEELGVDEGRNVAATAKAILIAINSGEGADGDDEDEDDDGDED